MILISLLYGVSYADRVDYQQIFTGKTACFILYDLSAGTATVSDKYA